MGRFGKKIISALKRITGSSSSRSHGSSNTCVSKPKESPMHEEEETEPMEKEQEQEQEMEEGDDDPHLDLEEDQETQVYNHVKDHEFVHTPVYDPDLLDKIGMDIKFTTI